MGSLRSSLDSLGLPFSVREKFLSEADAARNSSQATTKPRKDCRALLQDEAVFFDRCQQGIAHRKMKLSAQLCGNHHTTLVANRDSRILLWVHESIVTHHVERGIVGVMSEYDPLFGQTSLQESEALDDLEPIRDRFLAASRPFLRSPWTWVGWAIVLPGVALATPWAFELRGPAGVLFAWSIAILLGGAVEVAAIRRGPQRSGTSALARWALSAQGNLSVVAVLLSGLLVWFELPFLLPGVWLLLLGHSFYVLGGVSFPPLRIYGLIFQAGGVAALWPDGAPLLAFALAAFFGNAWMALAIWRARS